MKFLIVSILTLSAVLLTKGASLNDEQLAKLAEISKTCTTSSGVKSSQIDNIRNGNFVNDPKVKKYFGCMLRAVGVINSAGELQLDVLRAKMPKDMKREDALKILANCRNKKGSDADESAYLFYKCYWESTPNHIGFGL